MIEAIGMTEDEVWEVIDGMPDYVWEAFSNDLDDKQRSRVLMSARHNDNQTFSLVMNEMLMALPEKDQRRVLFDLYQRKHGL